MQEMQTWVDPWVKGNGNSLQYSCLENLMARGASWATVHGGRKELDLTEHAHMQIIL